MELTKEQKWRLARLLHNCETGMTDAKDYVFFVEFLAEQGIEADDLYEEIGDNWDIIDEVLWPEEE